MIRQGIATSDTVLKGVEVAATSTTGELRGRVQAPLGELPRVPARRRGASWPSTPSFAAATAATRTDRTFAYGSPLSVQQPASQGKVELVKTFDPDTSTPSARRRSRSGSRRPGSSPSGPRSRPWWRSRRRSSTIVGEVEVRLHDADGKVVKTIPATLEPFGPKGSGFAARVAAWSIDDFAPGTYFATARVAARTGKVMTTVAPRMVARGDHQRAAEAVRERLAGSAFFREGRRRVGFSANPGRIIAGRLVARHVTSEEHCAMALGTQPYGKLLDYEQYIDHQLARTRARIKMTDVLTACLILVAAALGVLFLEVVLDHAFGLPLWFRRIVLWSGLLGGGGVRGPADRPAADQPGQRLLRGQDDRGGRPVVQEQPDQLPRPPPPPRRDLQGGPGGHRGQGGQRPDPGRDRHGRQPAPADADGLRAVGRRRGLLPLRRR